MADFARFLPLSNRPRHDESAIALDWRSVLTGLAGPAHPLLTRRRVGARDVGGVLAERYANGDSPAVPDAVTGAAALAQAQRAPYAIRAVIRGRTVRASDAGWEFGSGPAFEGTARELILFLYGRGPAPGS